MTTYTTVPNSDTDQDSPVTQPLLIALRDNPLAISEGTSGAPKNMAASLSGVFKGYYTAGSGSYSSTISLSSQDKSFFILNLIAAASSPSTQVIRVQFSTDGGSTWGSAQTIVGTTTSAIDMTGEIDLEDGSTQGRQITGTLTVPSGADAIRIGSSNESISFFAFIFGGKS